MSVCSEEKKKRTSESMKRVFASPRGDEMRKIISKANKGRPFSEEHKKKISEALKGEKCHFYDTHPLGEKNNFFGKHHKKEFCENQRKTQKARWKDSDYRKRMSEIRKNLWKTKEYSEKVLRAQMLGNKVKPNKPECTLIEFFTVNNLPYKFVGDGQLVIGRFCPDFVNTNGQKKIIECFGDYWHSKKVKGEDNKEHEESRKRAYKELGFETLIIWEHELKDIKCMKQRIFEFNKVVV